MPAGEKHSYEFNLIKYSEFDNSKPYPRFYRKSNNCLLYTSTSYEFSEIEEEAKAAGVDAFIAKPLFRSRLTATLRQFTSVRKEKTRCV